MGIMAAIRVGGRNLLDVRQGCHDTPDPESPSWLPGFLIDSDLARIEVHRSCSCIISHVGT